MKKILSVMAMVIALTLMCSHINAQEAFTMKYNFKEGKAYKTITKVCTTTTQSMMGQEMKFDVNLDIQSDMNVTKVDPNGNTTMVINVKGNTEMNLPEAAGGKKSEAFTNEAINATFASNGQSVNQTMVDKDGKNVTTVKDYIKLTELPKKAVKAGDTWQDKRVDTVANAASPLAVITTTDTKYTVVGKEVVNGVELFKISYDGTMEITGKGSQMGMEMIMEGTGVTKGFYYYNPAISIVIGAESLIEMNTNINVSGPQSMTIPMTQTIKVTSNTEAL
ncbi:MAG: hypothetical protein M0R37_01460 [Bacteroidales bacterium]|nr:hypothetical protein [Bacteroidales bacterium]